MTAINRREPGKQSWKAGKNHHGLAAFEVESTVESSLFGLSVFSVCSCFKYRGCGSDEYPMRFRNEYG